MSIDFDGLWLRVMKECDSSLESIHGPGHWRRVERNGLFLASRTPGCDTDVIRLFALFHDSQRINDGWDPQHGARGAEYAKMLRNESFELSDEAFEKLHFACTWHTDGEHHEDPTIGVCWDADRLDLGRVGFIPDPKFMSTECGREAARAGSIALMMKDWVGE